MIPADAIARLSCSKEQQPGLPLSRFCDVRQHLVAVNAEDELSQINNLNFLLDEIR